MTETYLYWLIDDLKDFLIMQESPCDLASLLWGSPDLLSYTEKGDFSRRYRDKWLPLLQAKKAPNNVLVIAELAIVGDLSWFDQAETSIEDLVEIFHLLLTWKHPSTFKGILDRLMRNHEKTFDDFLKGVVKGSILEEYLKTMIDLYLHSGEVTFKNLLKRIDLSDSLLPQIYSLYPEEDYSPIHRMIWRYGTIERYLEYESIVSSLDPLRQMRAVAKKGNVELLRYFLRKWPHGYIVDDLNQMTVTRFLDVIQLLFEFGADDIFPATVYASQKGYPGILEFLRKWHDQQLKRHRLSSAIFPPP